METESAEILDRSRADVVRWGRWVTRGPLGLVLVNAAAYAVCVLPFFANGPDELPWRRPVGWVDTAPGTGSAALDLLWGLGLVVTVLCGLLIGLFALGWALTVAPFCALRRAPSRHQWILSWLAVGLAAGLVALHLSPFATEIRIWVLD